MNDKDQEFNNSWIILMADRRPLFIQVADQNCLPLGAYKNFTRPELLTHHFMSFCSLLSAARAALFCGSKAKAFLKSVRTYR
jgi:hypothetical protein